MDLCTVGKKIRQAREKKGWTQEQLAEAMNYSTNHISVIERGVKLPKLDTFVIIANVLDVDANYLLSDVLTVCPPVANTYLSNRLSELSPQLQHKANRIIDTVIEVLESEDD